MTLYIGVDIHARQQMASFMDTGDGTTGQVVLEHEGDDIKGFYGQFEGEVIIGIEAGQTAVRGDQRLKQFYRRMLPRRGKGRAKVAVGRKLLIRCFIMGRSEIDYAEFLRRAKQETE